MHAMVSGGKGGDKHDMYGGVYVLYQQLVSLLYKALGEQELPACKDYIDIRLNTQVTTTLMLTLLTCLNCKSAPSGLVSSPDPALQGGKRALSWGFC